MSMKRYVPEKIDIDKLINNASISQIQGYHPDKMLWILSEIAEKPCNYKGYAEIHSKRFRKFVHNYNAYIEYAERIRLIERDMQYYYDLFSTSKVRGYKFTEGYSSTLTGVEIQYLPIVKKTQERRRRSLKPARECSHLVKWFNPDLTVDYDERDQLSAGILLQKRRRSRNYWLRRSRLSEIPGMKIIPRNVLPLNSVSVKILMNHIEGHLYPLTG